MSLITEPRAIDAALYESLEDRLGAFAATLTHDEETLAKQGIVSEVYYPGGSFLRSSVPIGGRHKSRDISISISKKKWTEGHLLRHKVVTEFGASPSVTVMGRGYQPYRHWDKPYTRFRFSISIENSKARHYFTEKLIHPMLLGCVPIYWGATELPADFDEAGILRFETLDDLRETLASASKKVYEQMRPALLRNAIVAQKYRHGERNIERALSSAGFGRTH